MLEENLDKKTSYVNKYDPNELTNDMDNENEFPEDGNHSNSEVATSDRPKFKPTNATQ